MGRKDEEGLVWDLILALTSRRTVDEAALFLQDILTKKEMLILSRRLRIAKLLLANMTYEEIQQELHVSHGTIAKIAAWLSERGDGLRKTIESLPKTSLTSWEERSEWDTFKRRYSLYFWPELLLQEIVKNANKRQKARIQEVLEKLEEKSELHRKIELLLKSSTT